jgi:hypothetical protein
MTVDNHNPPNRPSHLDSNGHWINPSGVVVERKKADPDVANDWLRKIKESLKEK